MKLQDQLSKGETQLQALEDQQFSQLAFDWEGIQFKAFSEEKANGGLIRLQANLGRLFFTIENAAHRAMAIERLYSNNRAIDGAYSVDGTGHVLFQCLTNTTEQLKGKEFITALATILLQAETHLRTLKSHLKPAVLAA